MANELNIPGFKHYELDSTYQAKLAAGEVNAKDLSFVKETGKIYTQGGEYGGGSGECVADKVVRTLYGLYGELTDEQRAYNVETYQMFFSSVLPPLVIVGPINAEYNIAALPSSGEPVSLTMKNIAREFGIITLQNVTLNSDGSVVSVGAPTVVPINCNLNEPQYARIYFTVGKDIEECNPCILGENGMRYFIDASHASNSESRGYLMEYNTFEKRYRILIDPSTYAITSTEEIPFGGSGGGGGGSSDDMEAFVPLSRDFSDDFNNDYAR